MSEEEKILEEIINLTKDKIITWKTIKPCSMFTADYKDTILKLGHFVYPDPECSSSTTLTINIKNSDSEMSIAGNNVWDLYKTLRDIDETKKSGRELKAKIDIANVFLVKK